MLFETVVFYKYHHSQSAAASVKYERDIQYKDTLCLNDFQNLPKGKTIALVTPVWNPGSFLVWSKPVRANLTV